MHGDPQLQYKPHFDLAAGHRLDIIGFPKANALIDVEQSLLGSLDAAVDIICGRKPEVTGGKRWIQAAMHDFRRDEGD